MQAPYRVSLGFSSDVKPYVRTLTIQIGDAVWFRCAYGWRGIVASQIAPLDVLPPMADLLVSAGFRVRSGKRADCISCQGHSRATVAFTGQVYFCHRCNRSGNRGTLARELGLLPSDLESVARRRREARETVRLRDVAGRIRDAEGPFLARSRTNLLSLVALRRNVGAHLVALHTGARERFPGESEFCWEALRFVAEHQARASAAFLITAFGSEKDRALFALHPDKRMSMVEGVLEEGGLRADRGRWVEFLL
jgi:hypothetical protein